jgi:hypothetical protein
MSLNKTFLGTLPNTKKNGFWYWSQQVLRSALLMCSYVASPSNDSIHKWQKARTLQWIYRSNCIIIPIIHTCIAVCYVSPHPRSLTLDYSFWGQTAENTDSILSKNTCNNVHRYEEAVSMVHAPQLFLVVGMANLESVTWWHLLISCSLFWKPNPVRSFISQTYAAK